MKVILDGEYTDASVITPKLHKFIGTWRSPTPPQFKTTTTIMNSCSVCGPYSSIEHCWRLGHMDLPQYIT